MSYTVLAAGGKSSAKIIALSTANAREWWRAESERIGSNWRSLIEPHFQICERLQAASSSSWCRS
jgi:hypothetical protein